MLTQSVSRHRFEPGTLRIEVAGSIPDGIVGIFHWYNPSGRTMAQRSTQSLIEIFTRNISSGVKAVDAYGWRPYADCLEILELQHSRTLGAFWRPSQTQGHVAAGRMSMKNRTRDLPACSAVPQSTAPPRARICWMWWRQLRRIKRVGCLALDDNRRWYFFF